MVDKSSDLSLFPSLCLLGIPQQRSSSLMTPTTTPTTTSTPTLWRLSPSVRTTSCACRRRWRSSWATSAPSASAPASPSPSVSSTRPPCRVSDHCAGRATGVGGHLAKVLDCVMQWWSGVKGFFVFSELILLQSHQCLFHLRVYSTH